MVGGRLRRQRLSCHTGLSEEVHTALTEEIAVPMSCRRPKSQMLAPVTMMTEPDSSSIVLNGRRSSSTINLGRVSQLAVLRKAATSPRTNDLEATRDVDFVTIKSILGTNRTISQQRRFVLAPDVGSKAAILPDPAVHCIVD